MTYHGYEQHPDAHPDRPWWIRRDEGWTRSDRWLVTDGFVTARATEIGGRLGDVLESFDRGSPLPPPPPLLGQCWVWPDGNQHMVTDVCPNAAGGLIIVLGIEGPTITTTGDDATPWPPPGAVLAAGPRSPWAPVETP